MLGAIKDSPGVSRWKLHEAIGKHIPAGEFVEALTMLRDDGLIRVETKATTGRCAETYFPAGG